MSLSSIQKYFGGNVGPVKPKARTESKNVYDYTKYHGRQSFLEFVLAQCCLLFRI